MTRIEALRAAIEARQVEIDTLLANDDITPEDTDRVRSLLDEQEADHAALTELAELAQRAERAAKVPQIPQIIKPATPIADVDPLRASATTVRDAALRVVEDSFWLTPDQQGDLERMFRRSTQHTDGDLLARRAVATERPEYRSAFFKYVAGREVELTNEERQAVSEYRTGMAGSVDTSGGYGVPVKVAA